MRAETFEKELSLIEITSEAELFPILYKSYELSQGSYALQKLLVHEAGKHLKIKEDLITEGSKRSITESFLKRMGIQSVNKEDTNQMSGFKPEAAGVHRTITPQLASDEVVRLRVCLGMLNAASEENPQDYTENTDLRMADNFLQNIVKNVWERDVEFLERKEGRPGKKKEIDQWRSAGVTHLIRQESTNNNVFDRVYDDIHTLGALANLRKTFTGRMSFHSVIRSVDIYNKHHPDDPVTDQELNDYMHGDSEQ